MEGKDSFTINLMKGDGTLQLMEIASEQAALVLQTVNNSYKGVHHRSRYCVAREAYMQTGKYGGYLEFEAGDVIVLESSDADTGNQNVDFHRASAFGVCERTTLTGEVPMSKMFLMPSLTRPPPALINAYVSASDRRVSTKHQIANMMKPKEEDAAGGLAPTGGFVAFGKLGKRIKDVEVTASALKPKASFKTAAFGVIATSRFKSNGSTRTSPDQNRKPSFGMTKSNSQLNSPSIGVGRKQEANTSNHGDALCSYLANCACKDCQ
jgi:hypothetical protein